MIAPFNQTNAFAGIAAPGRCLFSASSTPLDLTDYPLALKSAT